MNIWLQVGEIESPISTFYVESVFLFTKEIIYQNLI